MRYLESKFSVGSPCTQQYADAWERTFGKAKQPESQGLQVGADACTCAPTSTHSANHAELGHGAHVGGCVAMCRGEGRGYQNATPSNQNEGGVSGFPGVKP